MIMQDIVHDVSRDIVKDISVGGNANNTPLWSINFLQGGSAGVTVSRASGATLIDAMGNIVSVASHVPRLDRHPISKVIRGLLVEEARTNYVLNSTAPVTQSVYLAAGIYTVWLKGAGSCGVAAGTAVGTGFGTCTESSSITVNITTAGTVVLNVVGLVSHLQCENGAFATSHIITAASSVTRALEVCTLALPEGLNPTEGTFVLEATLAGIKPGAVTPVAVSVDGNTNNNRIQFRTNNIGDYQIRMVIGGVSVSFGAVGGWEAGTPKKLAITYKSGQSGCAFAGVVGALVSQSFGLLSGFTTLRFGNGVGNTEAFTGWIGRLDYYPLRLSDSRLEQVTA